jgi:ferritin-like metal-binding protein YciE
LANSFNCASNGNLAAQIRLNRPEAKEASAMAEKKLNDLFLDTLKDIYFAERQILKNLPKMAKAAKSEELKKAFLTHRDQTEQHVERLREVFELIGRRAQAKTC